MMMWGALTHGSFTLAGGEGVAEGAEGVVAATGSLRATDSVARWHRGGSHLT